MGKLSTPSNFSTVKSWEELRRFVSIFVADLVNQVNGHLTFSDNLQGVFINGFFGSANSGVAFTHNLGYIPTGFLVVNMDKAATIYSDVAAWTNTVIFLRSSVAGVNVKLRVF